MTSLLLALLFAGPAAAAQASYRSQGEQAEEAEQDEEPQGQEAAADEEETAPPAKVPLTPFKHPAPAPQGEPQAQRASGQSAPQAASPHRAEPEGEWQGMTTVDPAHIVRPKSPPGQCAPKPPALSKINLVIHNRPRPGKVVLDSTPIVCSGGEGEFSRYCQDTMNDDARRCCPARPEGDPMRGACEAAVMGYDPSDGRYGPRWFFKGNGRLEKHPDNPYLAYAFGTGTVMVCNNLKPVVCNQIRVP